MNAPATAPTGPSTTAPDTAPRAALPARSCALASNETNACAISAATSSLFMAFPLNPSATHRTVKLRRHEGTGFASPLSCRRERCDATFRRLKCRGAVRFKKPAASSPARALKFFDAAIMPVICPTCQIFLLRAERSSSSPGKAAFSPSAGRMASAPTKSALSLRTSGYRHRPSGRDRA